MTPLKPKPPVPSKVAFKPGQPEKVEVTFYYAYVSDDVCKLGIESPVTHQIIELNAAQLKRLRAYPWGKILLNDILLAVQKNQEAGYIESVQQYWQPTTRCRMVVNKSFLTTAHNLLRKK